jgi:hypothetical protein
VTTSLAGSVLSLPLYAIVCTALGGMVVLLLLAWYIRHHTYKKSYKVQDLNVSKAPRKSLKTKSYTDFTDIEVELVAAYSSHSKNNEFSIPNIYSPKVSPRSESKHDINVDRRQSSKYDKRRILGEEWKETYSELHRRVCWVNTLTGDYLFENPNSQLSTVKKLSQQQQQLKVKSFKDPFSQETPKKNKSKLLKAQSSSEALSKFSDTTVAI